jgi:acetylornithine/succinyldiaminopimelate/putrescine aminotransferase
MDHFPPAGPGTQRDEILDAYARHVSSGKVRFFQTAGINFITGRREGPYLWDISGEKRLIDCHCNGGVFNLGHRNPEIIQALTSSLAALDIGNHHLISAQRAALAARLAELTPGHMAYSVFGVAGGEAIDLAIKIARGWTHRQKIISVQGGYHGHTGLALAAGDEKYYTPFGQPAPGFFKIPFADVDGLAQAVDETTAAVIIETVPATFGIAVPEKVYLPAVRRICDRSGALLIIDEVQAGLGRTGRVWGIEHFNVQPDILVTGKGLSGGIYPISATCFSEKLESVFHADPFIHISTFGGAEVGCPVALKVLEITAEPDFLGHVQEISGVFAAGFEQLKTRHPAILVRLRQLGMMMGIEMASPRFGPLFSKAAFDSGLLSVFANNDTRVAQLLPPLTIDRALAEEIIGRVDQALTGMETYLENAARLGGA